MFIRQKSIHALLSVILGVAALSVPASAQNPPYNYFPGQQVAFNQTSGSVVAAYIPSNRLQDGYNLNQIPANSLTHLIYAFLSVCDSGNPFNGVNAGVTATKTFCTSANMADFNLAVGSTTADATDYTKLSNFKANAPNVKILLSIGGGSPATVPFYHLSKTAADRAVFINSVVNYLAAHPAFDGVDIDWESPTSFQGDISALGPNPPVLGTPADSANYVALMAELRTALNNLSVTTGSTYLLTSAVSTDRNLVNNIDYLSAQQSLDYIFAMTYDYFGWSSAVGNHAALNNSNTLYGITNLVNAGVPKTKLVLGAAMYSHGWKNVTLTSTAPVQGTGTVIDANTYAGVRQNIDGNGNGMNGYTVNYDTTEHAYYLWNATTTTFIGYDDPRAVAEKGQYSVTQGLAGVFAWELGQDNGDLLSAMNYGVGNQQP